MYRCNDCGDSIWCEHTSILRSQPIIEQMAQLGVHIFDPETVVMRDAEPEDGAGFDNIVKTKIHISDDNDYMVRLFCISPCILITINPH